VELFEFELKYQNRGTIIAQFLVDILIELQQLDEAEINWTLIYRCDPGRP